MLNFIRHTELYQRILYILRFFGLNSSFPQNDKKPVMLSVSEVSYSLKNIKTPAKSPALLVDIKIMYIIRVRTSAPNLG